MDIEHTKARWQELQSILDDVFDLPESEWAVFIRRRCGDDKELLKELREILAAEKNTPTFLDQAAVDFTGGFQQADTIDPQSVPLAERLQLEPFALKEQPDRNVADAAQQAERSDESFIRRYRRGVGVAIVFTLVVIGYALGVTFQSRQLQQALNQSELNAEQADQVAAVLIEVMNNADPNVDGVEMMSAGALLQRPALVALDARPLMQAQVLTTLGEIYYQQGFYRDSRLVLERALQQRRSSDAIDQLRLANTLTRLGLTYQALNNHDDAKPLFEESLAIYNDVENNDLAYAETLNAYGAVLYVENKFAQAEEHFQQAIAILNQLGDTAEPELAAVLSNLANLQTERGQFQPARDNRQQALALQARTLGEDHSEYLLNLVNYAILLTDMELFGEAKSQLDRAFTLQQQQLGPTHVHLSHTLRSLGILHYRLGEFEQGKSELQQSLAIYQSNHPDPDLNTALIYLWLGTVQQDLGELDAAAASYQQMQTIFAELNAGGDVIGRGLIQTASLALVRGKLDQAANLYLRALERLPDNGLRTSLAQLGYAQVLLAQAQIDVAEQFGQRALQTRFDMLPDEHSLVAQARAILGLIYSRQEKSVQAQVLINSAYEVLEQQPAYQRPPGLDLLQSLRQARQQ